MTTIVLRLLIKDGKEKEGQEDASLRVDATAGLEVRDNSMLFISGVPSTGMNQEKEQIFSIGKFWLRLMLHLEIVFDKLPKK